MRNFLKTVLFFISTILIIILLPWTANILTQHVITDIKINNFKKLGVYQESISSPTTKYYKIASDEPTGFTNVGGIIYPGYKGDVLVSRGSDIGIPVAEELTSFFVGGHAAIVVDKYGDYSVSSRSSDSIEATGMEEGLNPSRVANRYYWNNKDIYNEVIGLRGNNMDEKMRDEVVSNAFALLGDPYNFSFTFETDRKSYCSDLITKCFESVNINYNKNGYWTTIYDIITSSDCHISYYHYFEDGVKYIYYLG